MANANTSVKDVTVIATPERAKVFEMTSEVFSFIGWSKLCKDCIMTNMSSMPVSD